MQWSSAPFANTAIADTLGGAPVSGAGVESSVTLPDGNLGLTFRYGSRHLDDAQKRQRVVVLDLCWALGGVAAGKFEQALSRFRVERRNRAARVIGVRKLEHLLKPQVRLGVLLDDIGLLLRNRRKRHLVSLRVPERVALRVHAKLSL